MTKTKKGFLKAGCIGTIIGVVFLMLAAVGMILISNFFEEKFVLENVFTKSAGYTIQEESDGGYKILFTDPELGAQEIRDEDLKMIVKVLKNGFMIVGIVMIGIAVSSLIVAINLLVETNKGKTNKKLVITHLVLSAINGNFLSLAFMIVVLCLKDKPKPTLSNIDQFAKIES